MGISCQQAFCLCQSKQPLLAQDLNPRQTYFVHRDARDFNVTQQEFSCNLLDRVTVHTKVQQFGGERSELANFRWAGSESCGWQASPAFQECHAAALSDGAGAQSPDNPPEA